MCLLRPRIGVLWSWFAAPTLGLSLLIVIITRLNVWGIPVRAVGPVDDGRPPRRRRRRARLAHGPGFPLRRLAPVPRDRRRLPRLRRLALAPVRLQLDLLRQRRHGELLHGGRAVPAARLLRHPAPDRPAGPRLHPALLVHARAPADPARLGADDRVDRVHHRPARPRGVHAGDPPAEPHAALRHGRDRRLEGALPEGRPRRLLPLRDEPALRARDALPADRAGRRASRSCW